MRPDKSREESYHCDYVEKREWTAYHTKNRISFLYFCLYVLHECKFTVDNNTQILLLEHMLEGIPI